MIAIIYFLDDIFGYPINQPIVSHSILVDDKIHFQEDDDEMNELLAQMELEEGGAYGKIQMHKPHSKRSDCNVLEYLMDNFRFLLNHSNNSCALHLTSVAQWRTQIFQMGAVF